MNEGPLQFLGMGALLMTVGAWGAFGPEKWNPLSLKAKYRSHVRPGLAKAFRVVVGSLILVAGVAMGAVGIGELLK